MATFTTIRSFTDGVSCWKQLVRTHAGLGINIDFPGSNGFRTNPTDLPTLKTRTSELVTLGAGDGAFLGDDVTIALRAWVGA